MQCPVTKMFFTNEVSQGSVIAKMDCWGII